MSSHPTVNPANINQHLRPMAVDSIEDALQPFLDARQLADAMQLWQQCYADNPLQGIHRYVHEITQSTQLQTMRPQIRKQLIKALSQNVGSSTPVASRRSTVPELNTTATQPHRIAEFSTTKEHTNLELSTATKVRQSAMPVCDPASNPPRQWQVFSELASGMLQALPEQYQGEVVETLKQRVVSRRTPVQLERAVQMWLMSQANAKHDPQRQQAAKQAVQVLDESICEQHSQILAQIIELLYVQCCTYLGAGQADRVLAQTVQVCKKYHPISLVEQLI